MSKGTVYARGNVLWVGFVDEFGKRQMKSTGLTVGQEEKARTVLDAVLRRVVAAKRAGVTVDTGPMTFERYLRRWNKERERRELSNAKNDKRRLEIHALPKLGPLKLEEITADHVEELMVGLVAQMGPGKDQYSKRMVRSVFDLLHTLFADAIRERLMTTQPCAGVRKEFIPKKRDKDPKWRPLAKYIQSEVEQLISDDRVPMQRRVLYCLLCLTGMRINEAAARRWNDYEPDEQPLGRLHVTSSIHKLTRTEKPTKTDVERQVPVHPTLAKMLAAWKLSGWAKMTGRTPTSEDLILPSSTGMHIRESVALRELHSDLQTLGLRRRSLHNMRRTLISLARKAKVFKDHLRPVTHGVERDQMDDYTTFDWEDLCAAILKVEVSLREGRVIALPVAVGQLQSPLQSEIQENNPMVTMGGKGLEAYSRAESGVTSRNLTTRHRGSRGAAQGIARNSEDGDCSGVAEPQDTPESPEVAALEAFIRQVDEFEFGEWDEKDWPAALAGLRGLRDTAKEALAKVRGTP